MESRWRPVPAAALPARGVSAHRGGAAERPENTLAAFAHAVGRGVHQVELDLRRSRDGAVVVMHDESVDRTTDGVGRVRDLPLSRLQQLDAGDLACPGQPVPTLDQALAALPRDVWINLQIKRAEPIAEAVAERVLASGRAGQVFVAGGNDACRRVRAVDPGLRVCNLVRKESRAAYVDHAAREESHFIQFHYLRGPMEAALAARAHRAGMQVNFVCAPDASAESLVALFEAGVDFVMVDALGPAFEAARRVGVQPLGRSADSHPL